MKQIAFSISALLACISLVACQPSPRLKRGEIRLDDVAAANNEKLSNQDFPSENDLERPSLPNDETDAPVPRIPEFENDISAEIVSSAETAAPPEKIPTPAMWDHKRDGAAWTESVLKAINDLGPNLVSAPLADASDFCPAYSKLNEGERKAFWVFMVSAIAQRESGFNPTLVYTEAFADSKEAPVRSRGLLQISYESGNLYGCGFKTSKDLHAPSQNLRCGVRILNHWIGRDNAIAGKNEKKSWRGGARYWAVLRKPTIKKWVIQQTSALPLCKKASHP